MTETLVAICSTPDCFPEFYDETLRSLKMGYEDKILPKAMEHWYLASVTEALDLNPNDINLPVMIREVRVNDVLTEFVEHQVVVEWAADESAPMSQCYLADINRAWELAEAHFRGWLKHREEVA